MRRLLLSVFVLLVFSGLARAEGGLATASQSVDEMSHDSSRIIQPISKWYLGATVGFAILDGWDTYPVDNYYFTQGYSLNNYPLNDENMYEWNIYAGYRLHNHLDLEFGYSGDNSDTMREYTNYSGSHIVSSRRIRSRALYVSTLLRPKSTGFGHGFYFKLGMHASQFEIAKSVGGNAANLDTIAAGDHMYGDGTSNGLGALIGIGFDFSAWGVGAIRLECNRYYRLGGTSYNKSGLNIGYQFNFQ